MKKLLFMGSSDCTDMMIAYAKSQGVYTIVTDYHPPEKSFAKPLADEFWMVSLADLDELEQKCRETGVTAVMCGINEYAQDQTIELCNRLGFPCYCKKESWHFNRNKADFKEACKRVGMPVATDYILSDALTDEELAQVQYPVVTKPVDKYCNQGISFCHNKEELIEGYRYARSVSKDPRIIVERMLTGEELLGLYVLADGEAALLNVTASFAPEGDASNYYTVNTTRTGHTKRYIEQVDPYAKKLLKEIGAREGFAWIQCFYDVNDDKVYAIEMGYRLPGDLTFVGMEKINHFSAVNWLVDYALGAKHTVDQLPESLTEPWNSCSCTYLLWTKKDATVEKIEGMEEILKLPLAGHYLFIAPGSEVYEGQPVIAFMFASENIEAMCQMVDTINKKLSVTDENGEELLVHYTDLNKLLHIENN